MPKKLVRDTLGEERDEVIRQMIATPPRAHKDEPKRRPTPAPEVRQLPKRRTNRARKAALTERD